MKNLLLVLISFVLVGPACGERSGSGEEVPRSVEQALVLGAQLGEGVREETFPAQGTGRVCVIPEEAEVKQPYVHPSLINTPTETLERAYNRRQHRAFWIGKDTDIRTRLAQVMIGDDGEPMEIEWLEQRMLQHMTRLQGEGPYLTFVFIAPTADTRVEATGTQTSECGDGQTLENFVQSCGTTFLQEEKKAEYFIGSFENAHLALQLVENDDRDFLFNTLRVEAATSGSGDVLEDFARVANRFGRLPVQYTARDGSTGSLDLDELEGFVDQLTAPAIAAISNGDPYDPVLGATIWQHRPGYELSDLCSAEIRDAFTCYGDFQYAKQRLLKREARVTALLMALEQDTYEPQNEIQEELFGNLVEDWQQLVESGEIDARAEGCQQALRSGQDVCTACDSEDLDTLTEQLDRFQPALIEQIGPIGGIVETHPVMQGQSPVTEVTSVAGVVDRFCYLSAISGAFEGLGEKVMLDVKRGQNQTMEYTLSVTSGQTGSGSEMFAEMSCADQVPVDTTLPAMTTLRTASQQNGMLPAGTTSTLNGIGGKMAGTAERVNVDNDAVVEELSVKTNTGSTMTGSAASWNFTNADFVEVAPGELDSITATVKTGFDGSVFSSKRDEVTLMSAASGICYLVGVAGEFDGDSEAIGVTKRNGVWVLHARAGECSSVSQGCSFKQVEARARCVRY